ncbi:MAG: DUF1934 domain-containing protein [Clostridia bacterium]|nr:DUF1934 domain-containing protein [Clostridia bacterium]
MRDITLKITGKNEIDDEEDTIEFVTDGKIYEKDGSIYLVYEESELVGMPGCKTTLKITGEAVKMARFGENKERTAEMEFEKGRRYTNKYSTDYGVFALELVTNNVANTITYEKGGDLELDYHISLNGLGEAHNLLKVQVN